MKMCLFVMLAGVVGAFLLVHAAPAQSLTWGTLTTSSGPSVMDWMVQDWIDDYFEDGSKGDGTVDSNIFIVGTSCYFGDFLDNFNDTTGDTAGGGAFDTVGFTNASAMSAQEAGKKAVYKGFDNDAAKALKPHNTAVDVFDAGYNGRHASETPIGTGPNNTVGGSTSTHVLVWAGKPNGEDRSQINDIQNNFTGHPNTTVTVLAGNGTAAQGGPHVDDAATLDNLKYAIEEIGGKMDDGADEQFVFYVTDHGNIEKIDTNVPAVPAATFYNPGTLDVYIEFQPTLTEQMLEDPLNEPTITLCTEDPAINPTQITVSLNGHLVGTLAEATVSEAEFPDGLSRYCFDLELPDESFFSSVDPIQTINIENADWWEVPFDTVVLGSGDIAKAPEPSTFTLLLLGAAGLFAFARRKRRAG